MLKLSVIILTYNSSEYIDSLIGGLIKKYSKELVNGEMEIILADNSSLDDTVEKATKFTEKIKIIENGGNFGYAKGNNLASKKASGDILLFLNPDAKLLNGDFFDMLTVFKDEKVGIIGGKMMSLNGKRELSCGRFYFLFNTLLLSLGLEERFGVRFSPKKERQVDFVSGGFMMVRNSLFERLYGFDENYFMYIEDSDLCFRAKKRGFLTKYSNKATIQHVGQGSSNRAFAIVNIYKGLLYFNKKNNGKFSYDVVRSVLKAKAFILVLVGKVMNNKYLVDTYSEASALFKT